MRHYLAIDGGNSKTDVIIGADNGTLLARVVGGGTCHQDIGLPEAMSRLRALVAQARDEAGLSSAEPLEHAAIFLAGVDLPSDVELLTAAVTAEGFAHSLLLDNDIFALLRAGTDAPDAVAVVCGAGINCCGRRSDGRIARFPALGTVSGDWGGGAHLGQLALWHGVRSEDGRGPKTKLAEAVARHFGCPSAQEVGFAVYRGSIPADRLTELAPLVFHLAAAGDDVARQLVARQAEEIVLLASVAARRLDLLDAPFTLVLGGGVLRAAHPLLLDPIAEGIRAAAPKAQLTVVSAPPVLGAGLSALDHLGAHPTAREVLRSALSHPATNTASSSGTAASSSTAS